MIQTQHMAAISKKPPPEPEEGVTWEDTDVIWEDTDVIWEDT